MTYMEILQKMKQQRWEKSTGWTMDEWEAFNKIYDLVQLMALEEDDDNGTGYDCA